MHTHSLTYTDTYMQTHTHTQAHIHAFTHNTCICIRTREFSQIPGEKVTVGGNLASDTQFFSVKSRTPSHNSLEGCVTELHLRSQR